MSVHVLHETVSLHGPDGPLSGELAYPDTPLRGSVIIAGPHPYMGGTKDNNVVAALANGLAAAGFLTLRFDYRALTRDTVAEAMRVFWTTGHTPQDQRLLAETRAARDWLGAQSESAVHLVGYSFGCEAVTAALDADSPSITLVAPTIRQHAFGTLTSSAVPKLVVYSDDDFTVTPGGLELWYATLREPKTRRCYRDVNHFFRGVEDALVSLTAEHLTGVGVSAGSLTRGRAC